MISKVNSQKSNEHFLVVSEGKTGAHDHRVSFAEINIPNATKLADCKAIMSDPSFSVQSAFIKTHTFAHTQRESGKFHIEASDECDFGMRLSNLVIVFA